MDVTIFDGVLSVSQQRRYKLVLPLIGVIEENNNFITDDNQIVTSRS